MTRTSDFYRPPTEYDGSLCFYTCVSVYRGRGVLSLVLLRGVSQDRGTPTQNRGTTLAVTQEDFFVDLRSHSIIECARSLTCDVYLAVAYCDAGTCPLLMHTWYEAPRLGLRVIPLHDVKTCRPVLTSCSAQKHI